MAGDKMEAKPAASTTPTSAPAAKAMPSGSANTGSAGAVSNESKLWAAIGYPIWILPIVVMVTDKKNDKWLLFHAYQALIFGVVVYIISIVTSFILIGCIIGLLGFLVSLYYGYKAYKGEKFMIPMIGEMAEKQIMK